MQSIRAKEHDNSFPYVSLAKTNRCWQLSHQNNLEAVNTGARAPSQHEEEDQAQTRHKPGYALGNGMWTWAKVLLRVRIAPQSSERAQGDNLLKTSLLPRAKGGEQGWHCGGALFIDALEEVFLFTQQLHWVVIERKLGFSLFRWEIGREFMRNLGRLSNSK